MFLRKAHLLLILLVVSVAAVLILWSKSKEQSHSKVINPSVSQDNIPSQKVAPVSSVKEEKTPSVELEKTSSDYQQYITYFEKVYKTFEDNYYLPPDHKVYDNFIVKFKTMIYAQLKSEGKSSDYVKWRSAWSLVDALKSKDDRFSQLYPPKPAEKFKQEALGQNIDLGIEGKKTDAGYLVTRMEPRSDAYEKGLRENDVLTAIDGMDIKPLAQADIEKKLTPLMNTKVSLSYNEQGTAQTKVLEVISKEYFKQLVFLRPVSVPGVFDLEIQHFNRATAEDLFRYLQFIELQNPTGLIIDLRDNPGGPPLAAREISSMFLKGGDELTYFQKRGQEKADLDIPTIPDQYKFKAPIVILVNEGSGSCSELFAGVMQYYKRAVVFGVNTAGQMLLKSMFPLGDGSMVALVVSRGYLPDGTPFSFSGVTPDQIINNAPKDGLINLAAEYLVMSTKKKQ
ncbi:MAG: PDZ domain-containing protein [Candidatus Omnitrophica bacterium]|nr:PDZ domain-containing protein [Candidatus Omnitrophota bacterium]